MSQRYEGDAGQRVVEELPAGSGAEAGHRTAAGEPRQDVPVAEPRRERTAAAAGDERALSGTRRVDATAAERRGGLRTRYGGFDWVATFLGFAVAIFFLLLLLGIVGAIVGSVAAQIGATGPRADGSIPGTTQNLGLSAVIGSVVALLLAYFIGGYAAGRLARYDGVVNGVGVVAWTVLVAVILGVLGVVLGSRFNVASQLHLNVSPSSLQAGGVISLVVTLLVMLVGAALGGALGARYHRRIDHAAGIVA
ncbi:MAG: hypothetical protein NVSMB29_06290 [Candidatus Dormibacteria bacterium]